MSIFVKIICQKLLQKSNANSMYIKIFVETPVKLTATEKQLLQELDKSMTNKSNHPKSENFFSKVADFFK